MIYCFDIDGTICTTEGMDYANAEPIPWMVESIQKLHEDGHEIRYYTARGYGSGRRFDRNPEAWERLKKETETQLWGWGLPSGPISQKPYADVYVDDHMKHPHEFRI